MRSHQLHPPTPHSLQGKSAILEAARSPVVPGLEGGWVAMLGRLL